MPGDTFSSCVYPYYQVDPPGNAIRRFDHIDDEGVIIAFCPNPDEAHRIASALMTTIQHQGTLNLLNSTHDVLRDIQKKLDMTADPLRT